MSKLDIKKTIEIKTNASKTWDVIGPNFLNISDWARGVYKSWNNESVKKIKDNAPTGGRYCDLAKFGKFDEKITHFNQEKYEITWSATGEKLPKFISGLQNAFNVEKIDEYRCKITANISANLNGVIGFLMSSVLKKNFSKTVDGLLHDLKTYAETGQVSETKQKELNKKPK
jgi:hypothetical protein